MKVLIHNSNLPSHSRHQRLIKLIEKVTGSHLFWARAKFEHSSVQINKFNKLTIEIFSKISAPLKICNVEIKMSQTSLNHDF